MRHHGNQRSDKWRMRWTHSLAQISARLHIRWKNSGAAAQYNSGSVSNLCTSLDPISFACYCAFSWFPTIIVGNINEPRYSQHDTSSTSSASSTSSLSIARDNAQALNDVSKNLAEHVFNTERTSTDSLRQSSFEPKRN